jgi:tryptophanyl-tRNA synthetase
MYLDIFDTRKDEVEELKKQYKKGGLGDVVIKKRLIEVLQDLISPIRQRRELLAKDMSKVEKIVKDGTEKVRLLAQKHMQEVRERMKINYF